MGNGRNNLFCWQSKEVLKSFRESFKGSNLRNYRNLYLTLTEITNDFGECNINQIKEYSGLSKDWIYKALKILEELNIIEKHENRINGKFSANIITLI
jgi:hypothetical protein